MSEKEEIIRRLKDHGCRITRQRRILIDIILENDCASCKEIFYQASQKDRKIGLATVYRMINALEEIGAIDRKNMYKLEYPPGKGCLVLLDDGTVRRLSEKSWKKVIREGLGKCGYLERKKVSAVLMQDARGTYQKVEYGQDGENSAKL